MRLCASRAAVKYVGSSYVSRVAHMICASSGNNGGIHALRCFSLFFSLYFSFLIRGDFVQLRYSTRWYFFHTRVEQSSRRTKEMTVDIGGDVMVVASICTTVSRNGRRPHYERRFHMKCISFSLDNIYPHYVIMYSFASLTKHIFLCSSRKATSNLR